jgi:RNA polymerase sigma factor (sigma-70 family)
MGGKNMETSKLIIVDENDVRMMTFEEILLRYRPLVRNIVWSFGNLKIEFEDKLQIANIALWEAYSKYNIKTGIGFWALAKKIVTNELKREFNNSKRKKRSGIEVLSLYQTVPNGSLDSNLIMDELSYFGNIEDDLIAKEHLKVFMNKITDKQKETLILVGMGKSYSEIAELLGQVRPTISMRMTATRKIFNECMNIPKKREYKRNE